MTRDQAVAKQSFSTFIQGEMQWASRFGLRAPNESNYAAYVRAVLRFPR